MTWVDTRAGSQELETMPGTLVLLIFPLENYILLCSWSSTMALGEPVQGPHKTTLQ